MKRSKTIHYLLIAVLFYGQLASSVHITGHLHAHSHDEHSLLTEKPCHDFFNCLKAGHASHLHASLLDENANHSAHHSAHHGQHDHLAHDDENENEALDCTIYHLLLNLNGGFLQAEGANGIPPQSNAREICGYSVTASTSTDTQRIRAPPAIS